MVEGTSRIRNLAQRVLAHEAGNARDSAELTQAADRIFQRVHGQLTIYIGSQGYEAVLRRALLLAQEKLPSLAGIASVSGQELMALSGRLKGLNDTEQAEQAVRCLLVSLLDVLAELLGWDLACRLVGAAWPETTLSEDCT